MSKLDIAIAGEINLDLILYGLPEPMPTERELLASGFTITLGSSSAILAHNLAALGSRVGFVTKVGKDSFGTLAMERLRESGVDLDHVVHGAESGVTLILPHALQRHILTYPGTISELRFEDLDLDYLASARHFHLSSLFLQRELLPDVPELFRRMKSAGLTTSLDTNDDPDDRWDGILEKTFPHLDILLPNEHEAMRMSRVDDVETAISRLAQKVETVVVKMGAKRSHCDSGWAPIQRTRRAGNDRRSSGRRGQLRRRVPPPISARSGSHDVPGLRKPLRSIFHHRMRRHGSVPRPSANATISPPAQRQRSSAIEFGLGTHVAHSRRRNKE